MPLRPGLLTIHVLNEGADMKHKVKAVALRISIPH